MGRWRSLQCGVSPHQAKRRPSRLLGFDFESPTRFVAFPAPRFRGGEPLRRQRVPYAEPAQEIDVAGTQGIDPRIETFGRPGREWRADERDRHLGQRAREARADRARADDDEIELPPVYNADP